uniref:Uncharacterized protein n=1 Tax=Euplotes crassus TaxID=5936 RepID=A0A7S3K8W5_EUPCR|mmetsp:Transcript_15652/g.15454  ORF Transcript_15652/g.15454 Transcript_15652/m.15454 type:complete len:157 (+) Transcript_15652:2-472(+)
MKNTSLEGKKLIQAKNSEIYLEIFPFRVPQSYDQSLTKDLGLEDTSSRIRCYNSVAYSTFTEVGIKLASQVKTYFYYEVLDGNHTFFSKKYEWKPNGEFQDQLKGTKFNWKIKTGNESIKIRLYSETVAQTNSSVSSKPQYDIDARVIGEVEFSLK